MISAWKRSSLASLAARGLIICINFFCIRYFYLSPDSEEDAGAEGEVLYAGWLDHNAGVGDPGASVGPSLGNVEQSNSSIIKSHQPNLKVI